LSELFFFFRTFGISLKAMTDKKEKPLDFDPKALIQQVFLVVKSSVCT